MTRSGARSRNRGGVHEVCVPARSKLFPAIAAVVLLSHSLPAQAQAENVPYFPKRLIDMHVHAWQVPPMDESFKRSLHSALAAFHVQRAIVSGPAQAASAAVDLAPGVLLAGAAEGAGSVLPPPAEFDRLIQKQRIAVLGELDAAWDGVPLSTGRLNPYISIAEKRGVPVAVFTGVAPAGTAKRFPSYRVELGRPTEIEPLLARHSRLRVYLMQAGWPFLDEMIATMYVHSDVYTDLGNLAANSAIPRDEFYRYLRALIQAGLGKRVMFGSGLELTEWADRIAGAVNAIAGAAFLSASERDDIFYENAARFLMLKTEDRVR